MLKIIEVDPSPHSCATCPIRKEAPKRLFEVKYGQGNNRSYAFGLCDVCLNEWQRNFKTAVTIFEVQ